MSVFSIANPAGRAALVTRDARDWALRFATAPTILAFVLIAGFGGVYTEWYLPAYLSLFLLALFWLGGCLLNQVPMRLPALCAILVGIAFVPLLQIVTKTTVVLSASEADGLRLLAGICAFVLAVQACEDRRFQRWFLVGCGSGAMLLGAWAIVQWFVSPNRILGFHLVTVATPLGPFVDHDDLAAAIELLFPAALALAITAGRDWSRTMLWGGAAGVALASLVLSSSRGGAAGLTLELALFILWRSHFAVVRRSLDASPAHSRHGHSDSRSRGNRAAVPWLLPVILVAALLTIFVAAIGVFPKLISHFQFSQVPFHQRWQLDLASFHMAAARPWMGWGLGTWQSVYPRFALFDTGQLFLHAHSDYAEWLAETGLVGTLLAVAALVVYLKAVFRAPIAGRSEVHPRSRRIPMARYGPWAARIALSGFALHATVDFVLHIPGLMLLAAVVAATAAGPTFENVVMQPLPRTG